MVPIFELMPNILGLGKTNNKSLVQHSKRTPEEGYGAGEGVGERPSVSLWWGFRDSILVEFGFK